MADLLDIAPAAAVVKIDGNRIIVRGLNAKNMASIVARFPGLGALLGGGDNIGMRIIEQFGDAVGPIIAAGCGHLGDEKREAAASQLLLEHQLKLLKAILGVTFPNGFGSFIEELTNLMGGLDEETKVKVHKVRLKKSPSVSQPSSDEASRPTMQ